MPIKALVVRSASSTASAILLLYLPSDAIISCAPGDHLSGLRMKVSCGSTAVAFSVELEWLEGVVSGHSFPSSPGEVCKKPTPRVLGEGEFLCRRVEALPGITTTHPHCSSGQASSIQPWGYVL